MPTCSEMCPIARLPSERTSDVGEYPLGGWYKTITTDAYGHGVTVTALESEEYPGITSTRVPRDAKPTCTLAERIKQFMHKPGASGRTERCTYVAANKAWLTVSGKFPQT